MKFATKHFVVAGIVGAVTASGAIATSTASNAAPPASAGSTAAVGLRVSVHISPASCTASDVAKHRQVSMVTVTVPTGGKYTTLASVSNKPDSLGGVEPDGMVWYAQKDFGTLAASKTVTTRLSWSAGITHGYLNAKAEATEALGGDIKTFELGGAHGLHGYSTVCGSSAKPQPTTEPPTPAPATTALGVTG